MVGASRDEVKVYELEVRIMRYGVFCMRFTVEGVAIGTARQGDRSVVDEEPAALQETSIERGNAVAVHERLAMAGRYNMGNHAK